MKKSWTARELGFMHSSIPAGESLTAIAKKLGRGYRSVKSKAFALGLRSITRTQWTPDKLEILKAKYGKVKAIEIATLTGMSLSATRQKGRELGLAWKQFCWTPAKLAGLKRLNSKGWSDTEIAAKFGADRHSVSRHRKRLGLPYQAGGVKGAACGKRFRDKVKKNTLRQLKRAGLKSLAEARTVAYKAFAKESGWPDDLRPRAVQILNLLASHGMPLTRKQIAERIGMPWLGSRKSLHSNDKEGSYLANLQARGLVIKLGKIANTNCGRGSGVSLYTLGPKALSILQQRAPNEQ